MQAPETIYLQIGAEGVDVTWCTEKINETDVEYRKVEKNAL